MPINIPQEEKELLKYLNKKDRELLSKHYCFYRGLETGARKPENEAQMRFFDVCRGIETPLTDHEKAYLRHIRNRKLIKRNIKRTAKQTAGDVVKRLNSERDEYKKRREEKAKASLINSANNDNKINNQISENRKNKKLIYEKYSIEKENLKAKKFIRKGSIQDYFNKKIAKESQYGIPEYEDGSPRGNDGIGGSREDCKKMRNWKLS